MPPDPVMIFVDGESMTIRGQHIAEVSGLELSEGEYYKRDQFLWIPQGRGFHTPFGTVAISDRVPNCLR